MSLIKGPIRVSLHVAVLLALSVAEIRIDHDGDELSALSVGPAGIWSLSVGDVIKYREDTRYRAQAFSANSWKVVGGRLRQIDVGTDIVWGVNRLTQIFYRANITGEEPMGLDWRRVDGYFIYVTVSPKGNVWAISRDGSLYYRIGVNCLNPGGTEWRSGNHGRVKQMSAGYAGLWAVEADGRVAYRDGTRGDVLTDGTLWTMMDRGLPMKYVASGLHVFAVGKYTEKIYQRMGITAYRPAGTSWKELQGTCNTVDTYNDTLITTFFGTASSMYFYSDSFENTGAANIIRAP